MGPVFSAVSLGSPTYCIVYFKFNLRLGTTNCNYCGTVVYANCNINDDLNVAVFPSKKPGVPTGGSGVASCDI